MVNLTREDRKDLRKFLQKLPQFKDRKTIESILYNAGLDELPNIDLSGSPYDITTKLIQTLAENGRLENGAEALGEFLIELKELVGVDKQEFLESFLVKYKMMAPRVTPLPDLQSDAEKLRGKRFDFQEWGESITSRLSARVRHRPFVLPQADVSTFTGREEELAKLKALLIDSQGEKQCSIVSVAGTGGIGKSALACHFATQYRDHFSDGVIGLQVDGKDVPTIAREFAREMGVVLEDEEEQSLDAGTIMQAIFASRKMLLIFDNADEASIKKLRPGGNICAVIVTTRDRRLLFSLDIPNEGAIDLPPLPEQDSLLLLQRILGEQRIDRELDSARGIIQYLGNLPLTLQITGGILKGTGRPLWDYLEELQETNLELSFQGREEFNLMASLRLNLKFLSQEEIDFFACLSVCAKDGFSRQTAMIAGNVENKWTAQKYLDRFNQLSLINYTEERGSDREKENRFVFHRLIKDFSRTLSEEKGLREIAERRHAEYFMDWIRLNEVDEPSIAIKIENNIDDIVLAIAWLQKQEVTTKKQEKEKYQFIVHLLPFFQKYGFWDRAIALISDSQRLAEANEDWGGVIHFHIQKAKYLALQEEYTAAEKILELIPNILEKIEPLPIRQSYEVRWLNKLGDIKQKQGQWDEAISAFERRIEVSEAINDQKSLAIALNRMGGLLQEQGRYEEAISAFKRQIKVSEAINDQKSLAIALTCMGGLLQEQGRYEEAISAFERQIEVDEAINDQKSLAIALNRMGGLLQKQGRYEEAISAFERQIEVSEAINDQKQKAIALNCMGGLLQEQGRYEEAISAFERQIEVSEAINDQKQKAIALHQLGNLLKDRKRFSDAEKFLRQSYDVAIQLENRHRQAFILNSLGQVLSKQGGRENLDLALIYFRESIKIGNNTNNLDHLAKVHTAMGEALFAYQQDKQAAIELIKGFEIEESLKNPRGLEIAIKLLIYVLVKLKREKEAKQYFKRALAISPNNPNILELQKQLSSGTFLKQGKVIKIKHNQKEQMYGWIMPSDRSDNIYFYEPFINSDCISQLKKGTQVEVFIKQTPKGWCATYIRILDEAIAV